MSIHPTAVVDKKAKVDSSVEVGPYAVIGGNVEISANCKIGAHAKIDNCRIGEGSRIDSLTAIGGDPQYLDWRPVPSLVVIGMGVWINELVTIHRSMYENGETAIGDRCMIMSNSHIAHDCKYGNDVVHTTMTAVGGHVTVEEHAMISAVVGVHQFVRIGAYSIIGGVSRIVQDVVPFMLVEGSPASTRGINSVGLKRKGFSAEARGNIKKAHKILFHSGHSKGVAVEELGKIEDSEGEIKRLIDFLTSTKRGIIGA
jgi:UDP-N-acetylglucosamine acyltransferase